MKLLYIKISVLQVEKLTSSITKSIMYIISPFRESRQQEDRLKDKQSLVDSLSEFDLKLKQTLQDNEAMVLVQRVTTPYSTLCNSHCSYTIHYFYDFIL